MIDVTYTCTNCGHEEAHQHDSLSDVSDIAAFYDGMDECPEANHEDEAHQYGLTAVETEGDKIPLHDVLWVRETNFD